MFQNLILILLLLPAWAGALPGCAALETDQIRARDLAALASEFSGMDPETIIAPGPMAGVTRVMRSGELSNVARRFHVTLPVAPDEVCFERASELLTEVQLQPVLQLSLGVSEIDLLDFSHLRIPSNAAIEFPRSTLVPSGYWRGRVIYDRNHVVPVWAKIRPVSNNEETRPGITTRSKPQDARQTSPHEEIIRGETVNVEVQSGATRLSFEAYAESTGRAGDSILVRNPGNGRLFQARVMGRGKALVQR
jgi:hypothetical protein